MVILSVATSYVRWSSCTHFTRKYQYRFFWLLFCSRHRRLFFLSRLCETCARVFCFSLLLSHFFCCYCCHQAVHFFLIFSRNESLFCVAILCDVYHEKKTPSLSKEKCIVYLLRLFFAHVLSLSLTHSRLLPLFARMSNKNINGEIKKCLQFIQ